MSKKIAPKKKPTSLTLTSRFDTRTPYLYEEFDTPAHAMRWVTKYLKAMTAAHTGKGCVVLDIDGTMMTRGPRDGVKCHRSIVGLFHTARQLKLPVFIITARPASVENREYTLQELERCGISRKEIKTLYMMPNARWENDPNFSDWKATKRETIAHTYGYKVLVNVGDQWSDMMRLVPYVKKDVERKISKFIETLDPNATYVLKLPDVSWVSVKVPAE